MTGWREEGAAAAGLTPTVSSAVARVVAIIRLWPNLSELLCARVVPLTYSPPNTLASAANTHTRARMDRPPRHSSHPPLLLATDGSGGDPSGDTYRTCTGRPVRGACRSSTRMDATGSHALAMDSNIFIFPGRRTAFSFLRCLAVVRTLRPIYHGGRACAQHAAGRRRAAGTNHRRGRPGATRDVAAEGAVRPQATGKHAVARLQVGERQQERSCWRSSGRGGWRSVGSSRRRRWRATGTPKLHAQCIDGGVAGCCTLQGRGVPLFHFAC
jgi:hypothetical protein